MFNSTVLPSGKGAVSFLDVSGTALSQMMLGTFQRGNEKVPKCFITLLPRHYLCICVSGFNAVLNKQKQQLLIH